MLTSIIDENTILKQALTWILVKFFFFFFLTNSNFNCAKLFKIAKYN